jgi:NitT/TauT family transport system substrate-binding protein
MTGRFFRMTAVAVAMAAAMLSAGCADSVTPATQGGVEKPFLTVGAVPAADTVGLYIAQQEGLFAAEGLHVKIVPVTSSATAISDQLAGRYDVTIGNYVSYILAEAREPARLHILAEASLLEPRAQEVLTLPGSRIRTINDLKGKTIGVNVLDNIGTLLVSSVLADNAMTASDVHFVPIPFPAMTAALKAHKVDAAWLPEPFISSAQVAVGAEELFDADRGATENLPIAGYVVTQAWAKKYPTTAAAFKRAITQAQKIADTNRAAVERALMTYTGVSRMIASVMAIDNYPPRVDPIRIQRVADAMLRFGLLKRPFDVTEMTR